MALAAATVWEVRTAGSDTLCSGGYVSGGGGTDYSQQNAAQYTGTNLVIDGAVNTKVTSATHNFVAADVGNLMQITAGSGFTTGFFQIMSVAANAATLDRSAGTLGSTAGTFAVGGALLSPAIACTNGVNGNTIWVKSGTYSITSTTTTVAGGRISLPNNVTMRGYQTTRADDAARPVFQASGIATTTLVTVSGFGGTAWNIEVDGASLTAIRGFDHNAPGKVYFCVARNCTNNGFAGSQGVRCRATACTTQPAFSGQNYRFCEADANTAGGFLSTGNFGTFGCLAYGNTTYGFKNTNAGTDAAITQCTAYGNTGVGFDISVNPYSYALINCLAYGNTTYGFDTGAATVTNLMMIKCAAGANTTADRRGTPTQDESFITLTADPFVNAVGGNFALNTTAGGGAALRAAGIPAVFPAGTTTSYLDIGAVQHQDSGGGGGGTGPNVIVSSGAGSRGGSW